MISGTWSGYIQTNTAASAPFTLHVTSANNTTATVSFASALAAGTGTGTYNAATNDVNFSFDSSDGNSTHYAGVISKMGSTLTLKSFAGGIVTTGSGSCTPRGTSNTLDLSGAWSGTSMSSVVGSPTPGTTGGDITMLLAPDGAGGYVGSLVDSTGLYSGRLTVKNTTALGSPTVWLYHLTRKDSNGTTVLNISGGFDSRTVTFGTDGQIAGALAMALAGYSTAVGGIEAAMLELLVQRQ